MWSARSNKNKKHPRATQNLEVILTEALRTGSSRMPWMVLLGGVTPPNDARSFFLSHQVSLHRPIYLCIFIEFFFYRSGSLRKSHHA
jgi:hypothetical protein